MAQNIDPVNPNDVNVDNISAYQQATINVINQIKNTDIVGYETNIAQLNSVYDTKMRFIQSNQPQNPKIDMGLFRLDT